MQKVLMPKLGDTMEEGKILSWRKQIGDPVRKGDALAEIETEKVNIEVESFAAGVLRKILVPAGQTVPVGTEIALVGDPSEALGDEPGVASQVAAPVRASAARGQTGSAAPAAAPSAPRRQEALPVGVAAPSNGHANGHTTGAAPVATAGRIFISPIARRIAAEHQLDVAQIQGTGPSGRIIREDVEAALAQQQTVPAAPAEPNAPAQSAPTEPPGEDVEVVPLTAMRKTIARRLQQSMQTVPHFYMTIGIDTTRLAELRASINEYAATLSQPVKVTLNDLMVKAAAVALRRVPEVNASFDGERLLIKKRVNIGIAVALDRGLIVPVVRDADKRTVLDIAHESRRLIDAARTNTLKPEDFQGGTFSISNAGMYGVESFTAVINPPEAAILAVGAAEPTLVVENGQVIVRDRMKVTLSSDHRVLDGAVSARFLQELKQLLEQPMSLLM